MVVINYQIAVNINKIDEMVTKIETITMINKVNPIISINLFNHVFLLMLTLMTYDLVFTYHQIISIIYPIFINLNDYHNLIFFYLNYYLDLKTLHFSTS